jgi:hypothetical protein
VKGSSGDVAKAAAAAEATTEVATVTSDDSGNDSSKRNNSSRHSVSFSIEESNNNNNPKQHDDDNTDADDVEDDDPPRNNNNNNNNNNQRHYASDTFSVTGSLASLGLSARSGSNRSRSSYTTRSSRSSRSSHGSATTASTHSSKSSQERRQRRELVPTVTSSDSRQDKKKSKKGGSSRASGSRASSLISGASSSTGTANSLYRRNSKHKNKGKLYANLHEEHPTRYPQRSSMIEEEPNEDDLEDDGVGNAGLYYGSDLNSSNEDLFARTKGGNKTQEDEGDDFLGGLIASTTKKNVTTSLEKDDNASVGDTSFLSDLLSGHLNNGGDGRGGAKQRKGGSVLSGLTSSPSINPSDGAKSDKNRSKSKKYDDDEHDEDDNTTIIGQMENFRDEGMVWVRRTIQKAANWYEHGDPLPRTRQECIQWYEEGGSPFPRSKKEWVQWGVLALILSPLLHLTVMYLITGNSSSNDYYGGEIQFVSNIGVVGNAKANLAGKNGGGQSSLYSLGSSKSWAGSSMVMLSRRSSLRENLVLIPDADWIELHISRNQASTNSEGRTSFFSRKRSSAKDIIPKPPQRLPLPSLLDPIGDSTKYKVLFQLTASNGNNLPTGKGSDVSKLNSNANFNLWNAIQNRLAPIPEDAWPSWSHNSLSQFREDSYTLMFPYSRRNEARKALVKLAGEFGQSSLYEFITWSETPTDSDYGFSGGGVRGDGAEGTMERAGSVRRIGKDGSAIIIPSLPEGRSDVMIRSTIVVDEKSAETRGEYPSVVMRRVKDLPVEDELTMREFEGPSVDEISWSKQKLKNKTKTEKTGIK